jgi:hypothetical protein
MDLALSKIMKDLVCLPQGKAPGRSEWPLLEKLIPCFPQRVWDLGMYDYKFRTPDLKRTNRQVPPKGKS